LTALGAHAAGFAAARRCLRFLVDNVFVTVALQAAVCDTVLYRNDLSARHEAINAKLSAAETKVQKMREEEIQKTKYIIFTAFGRPFIKRFALCYRTVVYPVLSVCPVCPVCNVGVYCGQTAGWIKMPLGTEVGTQFRPRKGA